uniref:Uncharacterized protein n=1 Tax=Anopheles atroparvus TaxID=41427 RepID=A0A182JH47_ANOAO
MSSTAIATANQQQGAAPTAPSAGDGKQPEDGAISVIRPDLDKRRIQRMFSWTAESPAVTAMVPQRDVCFIWTLVVCVAPFASIERTRVQPSAVVSSQFKFKLTIENSISLPAVIDLPK